MNSQGSTDPIPLEQEFPELGELIRQIANKEHPTIRGYCRTFMGMTVVLNNGQRRTRETGKGRNSPCPCGSGQKFKRCCIIWY